MGFYQLWAFNLMEIGIVRVDTIVKKLKPVSDMQQLCL